MNKMMQWAGAAAFTAFVGFTSSGAFAADQDNGGQKAEQDQKAQIEQDYKNARAQCDQRASTDKKVCMAEAKGKREKDLAQLDADQHPGPKAEERLRTKTADADYGVAKARCDSKAGNDKDVCLKDAKAQWTQARADAKADRKTADARQDAAEQRCDSLAGDAKSRCEAQAKHETDTSSGMSGSHK